MRQGANVALDVGAVEVAPLHRVHAAGAYQYRIVPTPLGGFTKRLFDVVVASVALLGSIAAPGMSDSVTAEGVQRALWTCAAVVGVGGILGGAFLRDDQPGGLPASH